MKANTKLLSCVSGVLLSLQSLALSEFSPPSGKTPVIVLQGEVTIDGQQRPDLGRSFSDTLTGGFLKAKVYHVIDHLSNQPIAQAIEASPDLAPEMSAVSVGEASGARWIYVPRMIIEGEFQKLTMKKIRVSDGQVVDVFETHATGDRSTMFLLVGQALRDIYAKAESDAAMEQELAIGEEAMPLDVPEALDPTPPLPPGSYTPEPEPTDPEPADPEASPADEGDATAEATEATEAASPTEAELPSPEPKPVPAGLKLVNGTYVRDDAALASNRLGASPTSTAEPVKIKDPATETEERSARYVGTVAAVNSEWRFCVIRARSDESLRTGDPLSVKTGAIVPNEVMLRVTKIEGRQAVADLEKGVDLATIKPGHKIYQWTLK